MKKQIKKFLCITMALSLSMIMITGCSGDTAQTDENPVQSIDEDNVQEDNTEKADPVYVNQIKDGTYNIEVSSSSSMFKIVDAQLTVKGGEMSAVLTLNGTGYEKLYMGTGEEALADTDDK